MSVPLWPLEAVVPYAAVVRAVRTIDAQLSQELTAAVLFVMGYQGWV